MGLGTSGQVFSPVPGQVQPGRDPPRHSTFGIVAVDGDLAVAFLAQGAGVLPGDAHRALALLGEAGVIEDQDAVSLAGRSEHLLDTLAVEVVLVPSRGGGQVGAAVRRWRGCSRQWYRSSCWATRSAAQSGSGPGHVTLAAPVKSTWNGSRNAANSGSGSAGTCGIRIVVFIHHYTPEHLKDKAVLGTILSPLAMRHPSRRGREQRHGTTWESARPTNAKANLNRAGLWPTLSTKAKSRSLAAKWKPASCR